MPHSQMAEYLYSDGNGNAYRLRNNKVTYTPVETINSSSGLYGGGEPWEKEITNAQIEMLLGLFDAGFKNRTFRAEKRTLGSAEIRIITEGNLQSVYLAMRSPDKAKIESFFQNL